MALAFAQAALAGVGPDVAQELAKKSGLWLQLDSLGSQVRTGMANSLAKAGDAQAEATKARLLACADKAYGADAMRATAVDAVAGALQPADVPALLAWYDGALGHKVAGMEETSTAQASDPAERLRRGGEALATASADRKASLQAILGETRSVDIMADTAIEMATAVRQGVASTDPSTTPGTIADIRADLSSRRPQIVVRYGQMALPAYAFAYAGLNDDELMRYADYLASPAAKAYSDGSVRGVARALTDGSVKLGRCLKDAAAKP
jgi:hypothetical protein